MHGRQRRTAGPICLIWKQPLARHAIFALFIEYLTEETQAARIHIIGYSAGTRVVINALAQITLKGMERDESMDRRRLRLGHVILVGSDFDREIFGGFLEDDLAEEPETLTVYASDLDKVLGSSRLLFKRHRLGQMLEDRKMCAGYSRLSSPQPGCDTDRCN